LGQVHKFKTYYKIVEFTVTSTYLSGEDVLG